MVSVKFVLECVPINREPCSIFGRTSFTTAIRRTRTGTVLVRDADVVQLEQVVGLVAPVEVHVCEFRMIRMRDNSENSDRTIGDIVHDNHVAHRAPLHSLYRTSKTKYPRYSYGLTDMTQVPVRKYKYASQTKTLA